MTLHGRGRVVELRRERWIRVALAVGLADLPRASRHRQPRVEQCGPLPFGCRVQPGIGRRRRCERLLTPISRRWRIGKPDVDEACVAQEFDEERDAFLVQAGYLCEPAQFADTECTRAQHRGGCPSQHVEQRRGVADEFERLTTCGGVDGFGAEPQ
ncbi:Uncharacterised protein [Mycobacteroides abscessus subsp. abscessus]|nr:Uncharacterised protein [Mycobacteroides abscessus subsp. abscessus]